MFKLNNLHSEVFSEAKLSVYLSFAEQPTKKPWERLFLVPILTLAIVRVYSIQVGEMFCCDGPKSHIHILLISGKFSLHVEITLELEIIS